MHLPPTPELRSAAESLLEQLRLDEDLLTAMRTSVQSLHAALRRGDLPALSGFHAHQERLATEMQFRAKEREATSAILASMVGLPRAGASLRDIGERLPAKDAALLSAQRDRLHESAQIIAQFQCANANLIAHLRSYFRGVLSTLAIEGTPVRYGPSGSRVIGALGAAIHATG